VFIHPEVAKGRREGRREREALVAQIITSKTMMKKATFVSVFQNQGTRIASW